MSSHEWLDENPERGLLVWRRHSCLRVAEGDRTALLSLLN
jgi:hypothetical protein